MKFVCRIAYVGKAKNLKRKMQNHSVKFKSECTVDGLGDFGFGRGESLILCGVKRECRVAGEEELNIFIKWRISVRDVLSVVW